MITEPIILITIVDPEPEPESNNSGGNKGYNGLGVHKKVVIPSSKLEDETLPKLNADLDVNMQSLMNIGWMESDNIGSNELLLGQSTTPVEDYGITGVSWKTINNKYFGAYAWYDSNEDEYVLQFSSPNPGFTPNSWMEFRRQVRYNIDLATLEGLDNKALANKEWVLSKLGSGGGLGSLAEDLAPKLGGDLDINGKSIKFSDTCKMGYNSAFGMPLPFLATANIAEYGNSNMPLILIAEEMLISIGTPNPASNFFGSHFIRHMDIGRRKREREYFFPNPGITFAQDQWYALRVNNGVLEAVIVANNRDTSVWDNKLTDIFELTKPWELDNIKFSPIDFSDADANFDCTMISSNSGTDQYWDYYTQIAVQDHMNHSGVNGMEGIICGETQHVKIFVYVKFDRDCTFSGGRLTLTITEDITN